MYRYNSNRECTHAHQQPSYQSVKQSNGKRINTSETVEYALSKDTATEIDLNSSANNFCRCNCNNNSGSIEKSADPNNEFTKKMSCQQNQRDRLGFWGNDTEIAAAVSGLERLTLPRFNKVSKTQENFFPFFRDFIVSFFFFFFGR